MNVVEKAIDQIGSQRELAEKLAELTGHPYKQGHVSYWKKAGFFPPDIADVVATHIFAGSISAAEACPKIKQSTAAAA